MPDTALYPHESPLVIGFVLLLLGFLGIFYRHYHPFVPPYPGQVIVSDSGILLSIWSITAGILMVWIDCELRARGVKFV